MSPWWHKAINVAVVLVLVAMLAIALGLDKAANYCRVSDTDSLDISGTTAVGASVSPLNSEPIELIEKRTRNSKTYYLGNGKYVWDGSIGDIHYKDENNEWQAINLAITESDNEYDYKNTENNFRSFFKKSSVANNAVKYQERDSFITFTLEDNELGRLNDVEGYPDGNQFIYPNAYNNIDVKYSISTHQLLEEFVLAQPTDVSGISQTILFEGAYFENQDDGSIIFYSDKTNEPVWKLPRPKMYELNERDCLPYCNTNYGLHYEIAKDGGDYLITKVIDEQGEKWLSEAKYPLVIDTTVDEQVGVSMDDCYGEHSNQYWDAASDRFNAGAYNSQYYNYYSGARFQTVNVPQGATIDVAYLTLKCHTQFNGTDCRTKLDGEAVDDAPEFSTYADYTGRTHTAAVDWDISTVWTAGTEYTSPSIVSVIQEIVDRTGWVANNDLVIFWEDDSSPTDANNLRRAHSYDSGTGSDAPKLHIEFSPSWESYKELAHTTVWGTVANPYDDTTQTAYMFGEGFEASTAYHIGYYDGADAWVVSEGQSSTSSGNLSGQCYFPTYQGSAAAGTWHAVVYKDSVASPPETGYVADDPNSVVEDDFEVTEDAIPEFPTVIAGIAVAGLCGMIYFWMRRRVAYAKA